MTMDLILVRHAIAEEQDPSQWPDDSQRPLTAEGIEKFRRAARGLKELTSAPQLVLTSPYVRARQTADILAQEAGWPPATDLAALEPDVSAAGVVEALRAHADLPSLALVGHEPMFSAVTAYLCGARADVKKGGVVRMEVDALRKGGAQLTWLLPPKVLRAAR